MIENIFFDLDGTLWDFKSNSKVVLRQIYHNYNLNRFIPSRNDFVSIYESINIKLWSLYKQGEITVSELKQLRFYDTLSFFGREDRQMAEDIGNSYLNLLAKQKRICPNTLKLLNYLNVKYNLCILTNGFNEVQHKKLSYSNLDKYFSHVFTSDKIGYPKPNPIFFEQVLHTLSIKPEQAVMVGDDLYADIIGAKQVGIMGIYYNPKKKLHTQNIDYEVNNLIDIREIL